MKRLSIVTYTSNGCKIATDIKEQLSDYSTRIFSYKKDFTDSKSVIENIFKEYDALVFVAAMGIAVRLIAPYIEDKTKDIPVIVIDADGKYVIPVLSGHLGGANDLAKYIAKILGAQAVITTATDAVDAFSPDMFAIRNHLAITDMDMAKEIAARSLDGEKIGIYSEDIYELKEFKDISKLQIVTDTNNMGQSNKKCEIKYGIVIDNVDNEMFSPFEHTLYLTKKQYVLGVGCRKNIDTEQFEEEIITILNSNNIDIKKVAYMTSIDLKKEENAICNFAKKYKIEFITYDADTLNAIEGTFEPSEYVKSVTGVDNVCERSVMVTSKEVVLHKIKGKGVTVAVGRR